MFLKTLNKFSAQTLNPVEVAVCKQTEFALQNRSHKSVSKYASFFPCNCPFSVFIAPLPYWNYTRTFEGKTLTTALVKWFPVLKR